MRIAWVSRHEVLPAQRRALGERFGRVEIVKIVDTFTSADNVLRRLDAIGAEAAVVVLPLSMISALTEARPDFTWIWSEMRLLHQCGNPFSCPLWNPDTDAWLPSREGAGRHVRFVGFRRIRSVRMELEPL